MCAPRVVHLGRCYHGTGPRVRTRAGSAPACAEQGSDPSRCNPIVAVGRVRPFEVQLQRVQGKGPTLRSATQTLQSEGFDPSRCNSSVCRARVRPFEVQPNSCSRKGPTLPARTQTLQSEGSDPSCENPNDVGGRVRPFPEASNVVCRWVRPSPQDPNVAAQVANAQTTGLRPPHRSRWRSWRMAHGHSMMVCWTERDDGETTRIISARRCTSSEWDRLRERAWQH